MVFLVAIGSATAVQTAIVNGMFTHAMTITTNHPVDGGITMESNGVVEGDTPADIGAGTGETRDGDAQTGAGKTAGGAATAGNAASDNAASAGGAASSNDETTTGSSATPPTGSVAPPSGTAAATPQADDKYRVDWGKDGSFTITTPYGVSIWNQDTVTNGLRISAAVIFALFGGASVLVIWLVTSRMSRQLKSISDQAAMLDPGKLDTRVDIGGGGHGIVGQSTEVTQLGNAINGMLDRIQTTAEAERRFVSNASHELRTPIAAVETNLDAPLAQGRFPADVEPSVRRALAANRRGARLVQALLTLSRIQSGALGAAGRKDCKDCKRTEDGAGSAGGPGGAGGSVGMVGSGGTVGSVAAGSVNTRGSACGSAVAGASGMAGAAGGPSANLADCVTRAIADVEDDAEAHDIAIRADDLPAVAIAANPTLLDLAVGNLVRNAVIHNVDGGSVDVEIQRSSQLITLAVTNTTDETLPDDLNELTQPFHRGEHSRISAVPGVGLGLSIVAAACDALGARLVLSRPLPTTFRAALSIDISIGSDKPATAAAAGLVRR